MNLDIIKMDLKRMKKHLIVAIIAPVAYSALIMVFYIAFADVFKDMQGFFNDASLQGLLRAFSMDTNTFSYILNYYVSYNGVYMLIMGICFAASLSVRLFSKELKDGTYEFIYANPQSRIKIFLSKSMIVVIYLVIVNLLVFLVGFTSLEMLKSKSPTIAWVNAENQEMLNEKVDVSNISYFERNDVLFYDVIYSNLENQYTMASEVIDMDPEIVNNLLSAFLKDPDGIFDEMLDNKDLYMPLFETTDESVFNNTLEMQKKAYFTVKDSFKTDDSSALALFETNPKAFLNQVIVRDDVEGFKVAFNLSDKESEDLFIKYSLSNYIKLSFTSFMVMLSISVFVMMIVIIVPKGKMTSGIAIGICFLFYTINMMSNIAEPIKNLRYITPLSYINMDVMDVAYSTETWANIVMVTLIVLSYTVSAITISKKDLIT
jgi:hypothetical protein